jgi:hypothetical protein
MSAPVSYGYNKYKFFVSSIDEREWVTTKCNRASILRAETSNLWACEEQLSSLGVSLYKISGNMSSSVVIVPTSGGVQIDSRPRMQAQLHLL